MPQESTAMLFCPPLPPLRLGTRTPIFIGRHPSCELAIRQDDISRRHAEVRREGGGYVLYDLESTNGTYLNGVRLEGSERLAPGDRIEIGSATITFCQLDREAAPPCWGDGDGARTVICERPASSNHAFSGELSEVPAAALFQLLEMGSNSGLLEIQSNAGKAAVWFRMGSPIHAASEKCIGFDAAIDVVNVLEGRFSFGPHDETIEPTIQASVTELLLEACRLQDEEGAKG